MRLREVIVLTIVFAALFGIMVKAIQVEKESADVLLCRAKAAKLAHGVVQYEGAKGCLPPMMVIGGHAKLPGWNLRILPYIEHEAVHDTLMQNFLYSPALNSLINYNAVNEAVASVPEYRCASRQPEPVIKTTNSQLSGVTTDYATPFIKTNYKARWVTTQSSNWSLESPFMIYELDQKNNTWRVVRRSTDWRDGTSNTLLISEKYIPDWAVTGDTEYANTFNGGLYRSSFVALVPVNTRWKGFQYHDIGIPQASAQCYLSAAHPIVKDDQQPFAEKQVTVKTPRIWFSCYADEQNWYGNYAWGSAHRSLRTQQGRIDLLKIHLATVASLRLLSRVTWIVRQT